MTDIAPTRAQDRITELDTLRGFALFGVLLGIASEYILFGFASTYEQVEALPSAALDQRVSWFVRLLVTDKANTLFAFLFGLGFALQLERLRQRLPDYARVYLRRLFVLAVFGFVHAFFIQPFDILHLYGVLGFLLFLFRNASNRTLLLVGIPCALLGQWLGEFVNYFGLRAFFDSDWYYGDAAVNLRQTLSATHDYAGYVAHIAGYQLRDWFLGGPFLFWSIYAFGRFLIGAYVGRRGWLFRPARYLGVFRALLLPCLFGGLALEAFVLETEPGSAWASGLLALAHFIATPLIATGYICLIVVASNTRPTAWLVSRLAAVGRMALSNYVLAGLIVSFTYFGYFGGADLAGEVGMATIIAICSAGFVGLVVLSNAWLRLFAYGPLEWGWRCLTYGRFFPLRR